MSDQHVPALRRRFLEDMRIKGLQPKTQTMYLRAMRDFTQFLGRSPDTATPEDLRAFQLDMKEKGVGAPTFNNRLSVLGFFFSVMRAGEVVRLRVGDIDGEQKIIRIVQSKGRKDRNVMLPGDILGLLRDWWKERPTSQDARVAGNDRVIFPGYNGKHLSTRQISRLFKQAAKAAGITKPVTLHTLRHSFATHLLERGVDIRVIQALLGHTKLTTTARYASVATGMISAVESPLDNLNQAAKRKRRKTGSS